MPYAYITPAILPEYTYLSLPILWIFYACLARFVDQWCDLLQNNGRCAESVSLVVIAEISLTLSQ